MSGRTDGCGGMFASADASGLATVWAVHDEMGLPTPVRGSRTCCYVWYTGLRVCARFECLCSMHWAVVRHVHALHQPPWPSPAMEMRRSCVLERQRAKSSPSRHWVHWRIVRCRRVRVAVTHACRCPCRGAPGATARFRCLLPSPVTAMCAAANGRLLVGTDSGVLYALDLADGSEVRRISDLTPSAVASVAVARGATSCASGDRVG